MSQQSISAPASTSWESGASLICTVQMLWQCCVSGFYRRCHFTQIIPDVLIGIVVEFLHIPHDLVARYWQCPVRGWPELDREVSKIFTWKPSESEKVQTLLFRNTFSRDYAATNGPHILSWKIGVEFPLTIQHAVQCSLGFLSPNTLQRALPRDVSVPYVDTVSAHCRLMVTSVSNWAPNRAPSKCQSRTRAVCSVTTVYSRKLDWTFQDQRWQSMTPLSRDHISNSDLALFVELVLSGQTQLFRVKFTENSDWVNVHCFGQRQGLNLFSGDRCLALSVLGVSKLKLLESDCKRHHVHTASTKRECPRKRKADDTTSAESEPPHKKFKRYVCMVSITS